jgi:DNA-binding transcriptional ArsR family regulator
MLESAAFRALSDPTRRAVFERLAAGELTVSELKAGFTISQPAISQHLATLRGAGLVRERHEGRFTYYRADPRGLTHLAKWIDRYRHSWQKSRLLPAATESMSEKAP